MYYPAAMSNHHAEYGGLLYHIKKRTLDERQQAVRGTRIYPETFWLLELRFTISRSLMRFCRTRTAYRQAILWTDAQVHRTVNYSVNDLCKELGIGEEKGGTARTHDTLSSLREPGSLEALRATVPRGRDAALPGYCRCEDVRYGGRACWLQTVSFGDRVWPLIIEGCISTF